MAHRNTVALHESPEDLGRRERKKQQTRDALIEAALSLFERKGYDETTVEDIADQVDLSARTFFRYFSSKEEVLHASKSESAALSVQDRQVDAIVSALQERPGYEPVLTALRRACVTVLKVDESFDAGLLLQSVGLVSKQAVPVPEGAQRRLLFLAEAVAERIEVDPDFDYRPHLASALTGCAFRLALVLMERRSHAFPTLDAAVDEAFGLLEAGIRIDPFADPQE